MDVAAWKMDLAGCAHQRRNIVAKFANESIRDEVQLDARSAGLLKARGVTNLKVNASRLALLLRGAGQVQNVSNQGIGLLVNRLFNYQELR